MVQLIFATVVFSAVTQGITAAQCFNYDYFILELKIKDGIVIA